MFSKKRVIADAEQLSVNWSPVVLRFFQMFVGDQSVAEALTIDTLAEHVRHLGTSPNGEARVPLMRRALQKAAGASVAPDRVADPLLRALSQLEPRRRAVIVFFRGLSLDFATISEITGIDQRQVRRTCIEALDELRALLAPVPPVVPTAPTFRDSR